MRIKDILPENTRYRRMAPKTLDTIYAKQAYDRELAAVNAANAAKQLDIKNAKKREQYAKDKEAGLIEMPIQVYSIYIERHLVRHWRKTHDREWALEHAKRWRRIKQAVPTHIKQEIYNDPSYQAAVIRIWDLADLVLKTYEMPPPNFGVASGFSRLDRVGADKQDAVDAVIDLTDAVKKVLRKNNIDDTGRQLPPQR